MRESPLRDVEFNFRGNSKYYVGKIDNKVLTDKKASAPKFVVKDKKTITYEK